MKHKVLALKLHPGKVKFGETEIPLVLPEGCLGIVFCFESKKLARDYWGKDVCLVRMRMETDNVLG